MSGLLPFFSYYGSKYRLARHYPAPRFKRIIEPFAGSAGYALRYYEHSVLLVEKNPVLVSLWRYLIAVKPKEILALPLDVYDVRNLKCAEEARVLIGFIMTQAQTVSYPRAYGFHRHHNCWNQRIRERVATQVNLIRHWKVKLGCYTELSNPKATWFIDPPYDCKGGQRYPFSNIDYAALAKWCRKRSGQVIVAEKRTANWLPFKSIPKMVFNGSAVGYQEAYWEKF